MFDLTQTQFDLIGNFSNEINDSTLTSTLAIKYCYLEKLYLHFFF